MRIVFFSKILNSTSFGFFCLCVASLKLFYGKKRTSIHASVLNALLLKINIFQERLPCGLVCLVFSKGWGLKEGWENYSSYSKEDCSFLIRIVSFIRKGSSKSFISGQQKRHSLPSPHTKRVRKKILNSDNAFTGRLLNSSFLAADLTAL